MASRWAPGGWFRADRNRGRRGPAAARGGRPGRTVAPGLRGVLPTRRPRAGRAANRAGQPHQGPPTPRPGDAGSEGRRADPGQRSGRAAHRELRPARASLGSGRRGTTLPEPSATPLAGLGRFVPLAKVTPRAPGGSVWTSGDSPFDAVISAVATAGQVGLVAVAGAVQPGPVADQPVAAPGRRRRSLRLSRVRRRGGRPA